MFSDPVLSIAAAFRTAIRGAARARRKNDHALATALEAEALSISNQLEHAAPMSLKGAAIKLRASACLAEAIGNPAAVLIMRIANRAQHGRLRPYNPGHLRILAKYLRDDPALWSAAVFIETTLQWLTRPKLVFCNGPSVVNPSLALSDRRALASVRGRREAAT
jgi:hypothetical protein